MLPSVGSSVSPRAFTEYRVYHDCITSDAFLCLLALASWVTYQIYCKSKFLKVTGCFVLQWKTKWRGLGFDCWLQPFQAVAPGSARLHVVSTSVPFCFQELRVVRTRDVTIWDLHGMIIVLLNITVSGFKIKIKRHLKFTTQSVYLWLWALWILFCFQLLSVIWTWREVRWEKCSTWTLNITAECTLPRSSWPSWGFVIKVVCVCLEKEAGVAIPATVQLSLGAVMGFAQ